MTWRITDADIFLCVAGHPMGTVVDYFSLNIKGRSTRVFVVQFYSNLMMRLSRRPFTWEEIFYWMRANMYGLHTL